MEHSQQLLALWIGPQAQQCAHHFYHLQAEQFFDEEEDPTSHQSIWSSHQHQQPKKPRMIIFDTESQHLTKIRRVNHGKILKKMSQPAPNETFFPFQFMPKQQPQQQYENDPKAYLYDNWQGTEDNYCLIDKDYNTPTVSYELWESLFRQGNDTYQDKIRKYLQKCDFLRTLFVCSDTSRLGFTNRVIQYIQDECPKRPIVMTSVSEPKQEKYYSECFLPLIGQMASQVTLLVDISAPPAFGYFETQELAESTAPVLNSLLTPFMLKNSRSDQYIYQIQKHNRSIFNLAYTLPVINQQLSLHHLTDITTYTSKLLRMDKRDKRLSNDKKREEEKKREDGNKREEEQEDKEQQEENGEQRVSFANSTFLNLEEGIVSKKSKEQMEKIVPGKDKMFSESYVLKGNFKEVQDRFRDKSGPFEIKYLKGILLADPHAKQLYTSFYQPHYGQQVDSYPFHTVMRQHSSFGCTIRNYLNHQSSHSNNQLVHEWREGVLVQADLYSQTAAQDSD